MLVNFQKEIHVNLVCMCMNDFESMTQVYIRRWSWLKAKVKGFKFRVELSAVSLFGVEAKWVSSYIIVIVCSQIAAVLFCRGWSWI